MWLIGILIFLEPNHKAGLAHRRAIQQNYRNVPPNALHWYAKSLDPALEHDPFIPDNGLRRRRVQGYAGSSDGDLQIMGARTCSGNAERQINVNLPQEGSIADYGYRTSGYHLRVTVRVLESSLVLRGPAKYSELVLQFLARG